MQNNPCARAFAGLLSLLSAGALGQQQPDAVYVFPLPSDETSVAQPASVLRGNELRRRQASSIGDTLDREPGVHSSGMSPGASRPVIRGQDAPRVRVLDNGVGTMDASAISPDHMPAVETFGASRVEILRGPATLLYGGGAIGGLVNVISRRIPRERIGGLASAVELRAGGAGREASGLLDLDGGQGDFAWHLDAFGRNSGDYRVPLGRVPNSFVESRGANLGASVIGERGYFGAGVQLLSSFYGIPAGERARIDLDQARYELAGELRDPLRGFAKGKLRFGRTQYRHDEIEQAGDVATQFRSNAHEGRLELSHRPIGPLHGVLGFSAQDRRLSAVGAESFLPPARSNGHALFVVEELRAGPVKLEIGGRVERERHRPDAVSGQPGREFSPATWSGGVVWDFRPGYNAGVSVARAQRAPAIEELYANGPHAGTASFEVGDNTLRREQSLNLDFSLRKTTGVWRWKLGAYASRFRDYIFAQRQDVDGDGVFDPSADRVNDAGTADPTGEFFLVNYRQANARFRGLEGEVAFRPESGLGGRIFFDAARGRLTGAGNVARMAPSRLGVEVRYLAGPWEVFANMLFVMRQNRIAVSEETATPGYTRLDAGASYRVRHAGEATTTLFLQANNLLNEDMRVHTSFIKGSAPLPGRALLAGLRSNF